MVLTKAELIDSLQNEVRILLHLASKIEPHMVDYRPTPGQRSTLDLLRYLTMMGPALIEVAKSGFDPAAWTEWEREAASYDLQGALAAIEAHREAYAKTLGEMCDEDFRAEIEVFGRRTTRGSFLVNSLLSGCAAYRMQLFLYLKACGRSELNTMNLWAGFDPETVTA